MSLDDPEDSSTACVKLTPDVEDDRYLHAEGLPDNLQGEIAIRWFTKYFLVLAKPQTKIYADDILNPHGYRLFYGDVDKLVEARLLCVQMVTFGQQQKFMVTAVLLTGEKIKMEFFDTQTSIPTITSTSREGAVRQDHAEARFMIR